MVMYDYIIRYNSGLDGIMYRVKEGNDRATV